MRFNTVLLFGTVGFLASLAFVACGSSGSGGTSNTGGAGGATGTGGTSGASSSTGGTGASSTGGTGKGGTSNGGAGGAGCTTDGDCLSTQLCVGGVCKKKDGQTCTASTECANSCVDGKCTNLKADGAACSQDKECVHTCIAGKCAPLSAVGGPCDMAAGAGGAGAGGAKGTGGASTGGASAGGAGGAGPAASPDCQGKMVCVGGKCITPDGGSCADNVDCVNTCIKSVCAPISGIDQPCDDTADCSTSVKMVCQGGQCKLDVSAACDTNEHCGSGRCMCSNAACTVKNCKTSSSVCLCKYSTTNDCAASSPNLNSGVRDPQGCDKTVNKYCDGAGNCIPDSSGSCTAKACAPPDTNFNCAATTVNSNTCNATYHASTGCTLQYVNKQFVCTASCSCVP